MYPTFTNVFVNAFTIFTLGAAAFLWAITLLSNFKLFERKNTEQGLFFFFLNVSEIVASSVQKKTF